MDKLCRGPYRISSILKWVTEKMKQRGWLKKKKDKKNDCFWMENIFCLESHIHLCSRHTSANPACVIKTCLTWHAFSGARYWGFISPKLHVSTYRNQQHCWWFHDKVWYIWIYFCHKHVDRNYHIEAETKWTPFSRRHFQMHFLVWKCMNLD